jgi:hypothetical protein
MDLMTYWKTYGRKAALQICDEAPTSYEYFKHICNKRKRPSVDLARKMVQISKGVLTLDELLFPTEEKKK